MKNNRETVNIKNSFLNISVNCNKALISTQVCILAGIICLRLFAHSSAVRKLCLVIFVFDSLFLLITFLKGLSVSKEAVTEEIKPDEVKSVDIDGSSASKSNDTVKTSNATIRNKVAIPNPEASEKARKSDSRPSDKDGIFPSEVPMVETSLDDMDDDTLFNLFT